MNIETVQRFLSIFANPPVVKVDRATEGLIVGPFTIAKYNNKSTGINGKEYNIPSYTLDVDPGDGDVMVLADGVTDFLEICSRLVENYAGYLAKQIADAIVTDAQAEDFREDQRMLQVAYDEGYHYYQQTRPAERTSLANPYPHGIQHYREWLKGYAQADEEAVL